MSPNEACESLSYPNFILAQMAEVRSSDERSEEQHICKPSLGAKYMSTRASRTVLIICLLTGLLFSSLDTSIASTSLVTISHDLSDFVNAPWIILSYLLTYMGFAVFLSKLSDIYGRRNMLVLSWVLFTAFSLGCASSQTMKTLIICRGFQGIGASGLYSLTQIGLVEVGPSHRPCLIGAMIGATLAAAFVLGPIIGGVVSQLSDWRWLFNMNIPFGLAAILAITCFWPREDAEDMFSSRAFTRIDFVGGLTLLLSSGLLVFALQQAGSQMFAWSSPQIISILVISSLSWIAFICWEFYLDFRPNYHVEPILPIRLMSRRVYVAGLIMTFLTGFPYISLSIIIPERFQIVNSDSVLTAGVHILPLLGACAVGSFLGGAISSSNNNTSYTLVGASCLQLLGAGLMTIMDRGPELRGSHYAFQAIFGLGVGLCFSAATITTNIVATEPNERASAQGTVAQARVLGGCIGLSICTIIFNSHVNRYLAAHVTTEQLEQLHRSPILGLQLPIDLQDLIKVVYAGAFAEEIKIMAVLCASMVVVSMFTFEKEVLCLAKLTAVAGPITLPRRARGSSSELNEITSVRHMA